MFSHAVFTVCLPVIISFSVLDSVVVLMWASVKQQIIQLNGP